MNKNDKTNLNISLYFIIFGYSWLVLVWRKGFAKKSLFSLNDFKELTCHRRNNKKSAGYIAYSFVDWECFWYPCVFNRWFYDLYYHENPVVRFTSKKYLFCMGEVCFRLAITIFYKKFLYLDVHVAWKPIYVHHGSK